MSISPLEHLKSIRDSLVAEQLHEVAVPGWEHPVPLKLRIKPVDHGTFRRIMAVVQRAPKNQAAEAELNANAAVVGSAIVKVLIGDGDGQAEVSWEDLRPSLELSETATVGQVVRAVCLRDGDVIALAEAVMKHSGYSATAADEMYAGE